MRGLLAAACLAAAGSLLSAALLPGAARAAAPQDSLTVTFTPKDVWPPSPVTDLTALPGAEGQMLLQWTAPDSNNYVYFPLVGPAKSYSIRVATFSVASVGGSTTTWWGAATDVLSLPAPSAPWASPTPPPTPLAPGTTQTLLLNRLDPGATYYAMMISFDAAGNVSDSDVPSRGGSQAHALVFDAAPPAPSTLSVVAVGTSSFNVSWSSVTAFDLASYRLYVDSITENFSRAFTVTVASSASSMTLAVPSTGTYAFRVSAVDTGAPLYPGIALESPFSPTVISTLTFPIHTPQAPFGVTLSSDAVTATLSWWPTVRYADFTPFAASTAPTIFELTDYRVYRATSPVLGGWTLMATLSTATLNWTDFASGPQYYYFVMSENASSMSNRSVIRTGASKAAYVVAPDDISFFEIMPPNVAPIEGVPSDPNSAYLISASSRTQDLGGLNGRVTKSLEFDAYRGGTLLAPNFPLGGPGLLRLHYEVSSSSLVTASAVVHTPTNMSVYWYNGRSWVQLYGTLDAASQTMTIQTEFFGQYQLRSVERTGGFAFNVGGVSNRFITPNGDGKNDDVVFTFDNPRDSAVTGKIFDLRGRVVVPSLPPGPVSNSLTWDGTAGGRSVSGGVYIYQIQAEGQTFSGTLVIIK
jgi:hypothetical protein